MAVGKGVSVTKNAAISKSNAAQSYLGRIIADSGTIGNIGRIRQWIGTAQANGFFDPTQMLLAPIFGYKERISAPYSYLSKLYSLRLAANDAAQTTEVSQLYKAGNIAPNEVLSAKVPNGSTLFVAHAEISRTSTQEWTWTAMLGNNSTSAATNVIYSDTGGNTAIYYKNTTNVFAFRNASGTTVSGTVVNYGQIGKNTMLHFVAAGDNTLKIYVNKVLFDTLAVATDAVFQQTGGQGVAHYYRMQFGAMTPSQITAEYDLLRSWIPEIESVQIGSQVWASSNLDVVATPLGNVIANVTENGAVEKITQPLNLSSGYTAVNSTINDNDTYTTAAGAGGVVTVNNTLFTANKWYKIIFAGTVSVDTVAIYQGTTSATRVNITGDLSGTFNVTVIYKARSTTELLPYIRNNGSATTDITTLSITELNWSNATEIYQAVYNATSGTAAQKHYAAVKEAAMWCSYNNDTANQAIYGKLYNWYAASLLDLDMASAGYGWRVPTSADFTALANALGGAAVAGGKMKMTGTDYISTPNTGATNESGFTALGNGLRSAAAGVFGNLKEVISFKLTDMATMRINLSNSTAEMTTVSTDARTGSAIRLIKTT